jgi:hypothetical protein
VPKLDPTPQPINLFALMLESLPPEPRSITIHHPSLPPEGIQIPITDAEADSIDQSIARELLADMLRHGEEKAMIQLPDEPTANP